MKKWKNDKFYKVLSGTLSIVLLLFATNLLWGAVDIPVVEVLKILSGDEASREAWRLIVLDARLPQALTAMLSGMALAAAGLVLQTLFNNPLAGPEVFGINSGAGLGVAVVMLLFQGVFAAGVLSLAGYMAILAGAFVGALSIIAIIIFLSSWVRDNVFLLIAGLAVSYLTSSVIALLNYFSTAEGVHSYLIWGMGSFGGVSMSQMPLFATIVFVALVAVVLMAKPLNALLLGDAYAANLGIRTKRVRGILLALTGFLTAAVTAFCGPIAFIGLAVPHFARIALRMGNHTKLLPVTMLLGAAVLLACNLICQLPGDNGLIPLGAITPLIGAPVILYIVLKQKETSRF